MNNKRNYFFPIICILLAVYIVLHQLNLLAWPFSNISSIKLVATIILAALAVQQLLRKEYAGMLVFITPIIIMYRKLLHIPLGIGTIVVVAILLVIAIGSLFPHKAPEHQVNDPYYIRDKKGGDNNNGACGHNNFASANASNTNEDIVNIGCSFNNCVKYVNSDNFLGANVNTSFGETSIYLNNAHVPTGNAYVNVRTSFGATKIFVPMDWDISTDVNAVAADVKYYGTPVHTDNSVNLVISGSASFACIEIHRI